MAREVVAENLHFRIGAALQGGVGYAVEGNEINPAVKSFEQTDKLAGMLLGIVDSFKKNVFER